VAEAIGLPRADFVLYADDNEFTYRLTHGGGSILLVTGALIEDLESSWNIKNRSSSSFGSLLGGPADFRVYYGIRNQAYFEAYCMPNDRRIFWLNRMVYLLMLYVLSRFTGRLSRYRLIVEAVRDGLAGRLGTHRRFPL
jgi:GT2 family glycosyltransferase